MEDKLSTSTSDIEVVKEENSNAKTDKKDDTSKNDKKLKNQPKRKSWFSIFTKKKNSSNSPKADKKFGKKSKSLSIDDSSSISSCKDTRSMSDSNVIPDDDYMSKSDNVTAPTLENLDNKTMPEHLNNETTSDKDDKTTSGKNDKKTPIEDDRQSIDNETFELASNGDEYVVVKTPDQDPAESSTNNETKSAINNDLQSTSDGDTESILKKDRPNDNESLDECESLGTLVSASTISDDPKNNSDEMNHENAEDLRCVYASESSAATKNQAGDEDKLNSEENEYAMTMDHRLVVLRELVETEKAYVHDLSLVVDDITTAMKNPEAIGYDLPIPDDLVSTEKEELVFNNVKQVYEWHKE